MENPGSSRRWIFSTVTLCLFGFFKEVRPSENFLTEYLIGPHQNLTLHEVNSAVYPVWTYSYLAFLVPVFLLTDLLKYKPVIILEGLAYICTWSLLLWAKGLLAMQMMQLAYGIATATEIAYYSYIYSVVDEEHFQVVTSLTRGCALVGRFVSGALGQLLISYRVLDFYSLNYVSMGCVSAALVLSILLPSSSRESPAEFNESGTSEPYITAAPIHTMEHRSTVLPAAESFDDNINQCIERPTPIATSSPTIPRSRFVRIWADLRECYSNRGLFKWSVWWAIATCGNFQVGNYIQNLWEEIEPSAGHVDVYNGAVDAIATLCGAIMAFLLILPRANWKILGEFLIGSVSLADGAVIIFMALTSSIWTAYVLFVIFRASYQMVITIATCQIAFYLRGTKTYAMVFGCNTFMALLLQTLITVIVVDQRGLAVSITTQFLVNGSYYLLMGSLFLVLASVHVFRLGCRRWWSLRRIPSYENI
ncbi:hypothetical protein CAPTEDRAFT_184223 [Capitella teleta]|uniref:Major facilitator superfamily (MFS) profile domain-containing protein n=1 Tax=Capitella teleta TaxID=283909 RepID=X1ZGW9_CAPTE|nr:hypothetical protein CAPTEDRAFT_184223 [Capitella teleta]|eukprot:ELU00256.1 hypothetical protein CAPTEDRAFT_184223 [Capitella teleta]